MRKPIAGLLCLTIFAGCNAASTNEARSICESLGASDAMIDSVFEIAQDDREAGLLCLAILADGNAASTSQARAVCEGVGIPDDVVDEAIQFAQEDRAEGLSADESRELFEGDCEEVCGDDADCFTDCTTCFFAVVDAIY